MPQKSTGWLTRVVVVVLFDVANEALRSVPSIFWTYREFILSRSYIVYYSAKSLMLPRSEMAHEWSLPHRHHPNINMRQCQVVLLQFREVEDMSATFHASISTSAQKEGKKKTIRKKERIGRFLSNWIRSTTVERSGTKNRAGTFGTCYQTKVKVLSGKPLLMDRFDGLTRAVNWTEGPSSAAK